MWRLGCGDADLHPLWCELDLGACHSRHLWAPRPPCIENGTGKALRIGVFVMNYVFVSKISKKLEILQRLRWLTLVNSLGAELKAGFGVSKAFHVVNYGRAPKRAAKYYGMLWCLIDRIQTVDSKIKINLMQCKVSDILRLGIIEPN